MSQQKLAKLAELLTQISNNQGTADTTDIHHRCTPNNTLSETIQSALTQYVNYIASDMITYLAKLRHHGDKDWNHYFNLVIEDRKILKSVQNELQTVNLFNIRKILIKRIKERITATFPDNKWEKLSEVIILEKHLLDLGLPRDFISSDVDVVPYITEQWAKYSPEDIQGLLMNMEKAK